MGTTVENGVQLQEWTEAHQPAADLIYKNGYWEQITFVQHKISSILAKTYEEYLVIKNSIQVISEHTSKSVRLPVFRIELADGTKFTLRYNFHDWKVSVNSFRDVEVDFMGLFNPNERIHEVYCEGFPNGLVYGPHAKNKRQFTIELPSDYHLFTFFWIFAYKVLGNTNKNESGV